MPDITCDYLLVNDGKAVSYLENYILVFEDINVTVYTSGLPDSLRLNTHTTLNTNYTQVTFPKIPTDNITLDILKNNTNESIYVGPYFNPNDFIEIDKKYRLYKNNMNVCYNNGHLIPSLMRNSTIVLNTSIDRTIHADFKVKDNMNLLDVRTLPLAIGNKYNISDIDDGLYEVWNRNGERIENIRPMYIDNTLRVDLIKECYISSKSSNKILKNYDIEVNYNYPLYSKIHGIIVTLNTKYVYVDNELRAYAAKINELAIPKTFPLLPETTVYNIDFGAKIEIPRNIAALIFSNWAYHSMDNLKSSYEVCIPEGIIRIEKNILTMYLTQELTIISVINEDLTNSYMVIKQSIQRSSSNNNRNNLIELNNKVKLHIYPNTTYHLPLNLPCGKRYYYKDKQYLEIETTAAGQSKLCFCNIDGTFAIPTDTKTIKLENISLIIDNIDSYLYVEPSIKEFTPKSLIVEGTESLTLISINIPRVYPPYLSHKETNVIALNVESYSKDYKASTYDLFKRTWGVDDKPISLINEGINKINCPNGIFYIDARYTYSTRYINWDHNKLYTTRSRKINDTTYVAKIEKSINPTSFYKKININMTKTQYNYLYCQIDGKLPYSIICNNIENKEEDAKVLMKSNILIDPSNEDCFDLPSSCATKHISFVYRDSMVHIYCNEGTAPCKEVYSRYPLWNAPSIKYHGNYYPIKRAAPYDSYFVYVDSDATDTITICYNKIESYNQPAKKIKSNSKICLGLADSLKCLETNVIESSDKYEDVKSVINNKEIYSSMKITHHYIDI
jgi:hypothetical protein